MNVDEELLSLMENLKKVKNKKTRNFIEDIYEFYIENGYLTWNQEEVIQKIYSECETNL